MEWYNDSFVKFINAFSAPYKKTDLTKQCNFDDFKKKYILNLKKVNNDKNSHYCNMFNKTLLEVEKFFPSLKRMFYCNETIAEKDFLSYLTENDIVEDQSFNGNGLYRVVTGNVQEERFFSNDELYFVPADKVKKQQRYNEAGQSTMYLSEHALLCWHESNKPSYFTLAFFEKRLDNNLKYFAVKSGEQIIDEANLCCFDGYEEQLVLIKHFVILNPLYILLSQKNNDNDYILTNVFLKWIKSNSIADGIAYCNCADYSDGRMIDNKELHFSKTNYAIPIDSTNVETIKKIFLLKDEKYYDLRKEFDNRKICKKKKIEIMRKHFDADRVFL